MKKLLILFIIGLFASANSLAQQVVPILRTGLNQGWQWTNIDRPNNEANFINARTPAELGNLAFNNPTPNANVVGFDHPVAQEDNVNAGINQNQLASSIWADNSNNTPNSGNTLLTRSFFRNTFIFNNANCIELRIFADNLSRIYINDQLVANSNLVGNSGTFSAIPPNPANVGVLINQLTTSSAGSWDNAYRTILFPANSNFLVAGPNTIIVEVIDQGGFAAVSNRASFNLAIVPVPPPLDPVFNFSACREVRRIGLTRINVLNINAAATNNNVNNSWQIYEAINCNGDITDNNMVNKDMPLVFPNNIITNANNFSTLVLANRCYIIKHGTWNNCNGSWTESRQFIQSGPPVSTSFSVRDIETSPTTYNAEISITNPPLGTHIFRLERLVNDQFLPIGQPVVHVINNNTNFNQTVFTGLFYGPAATATFRIFHQVIPIIPNGPNGVCNTGVKPFHFGSPGSIMQLCADNAVLKASVFLDKVTMANTKWLMNDDLRTSNLVPLSDPYRTSPLSDTYTHVRNDSTETTTQQVLSVTGDNAIVDWVFLELRSGTSQYTEIEYTRSALLQRDGDIVDMDGVSPVEFSEAIIGSYYVTVRHRNHLGIRTSNKLPLFYSSEQHNFTNNSIPLYYNEGPSNPLTQVALGVYKMNGGDANTDGSVDAFDTINWELQQGLWDGYFSADYNLDGSVDAFDSIIWEIHNGKFQELD